MLLSRSMKHVPTSRNVKGFRSCPQATGLSMAHCEAQQLVREKTKLELRELRRRWLGKQWLGTP